MQHAHGEGARTAGRVKHAQLFNAGNQRVYFLGLEVVAGVAVAEQAAQAVWCLVLAVLALTPALSRLREREQVRRAGCQTQVAWTVAKVEQAICYNVNSWLRINNGR